MGRKLAPLGLLLLVAGAALALGTGDWRWAVYGLLALAAYGAVCATVDNLRRPSADDERSES